MPDLITTRQNLNLGGFRFLFIAAAVDAVVVVVRSSVVLCVKTANNNMNVKVKDIEDHGSISFRT